MTTRCSLCTEQTRGLWPITEVLDRGRKLSDGALQQLTGHEKRTTADRHVLMDAPMHRHTARAQRVQIAPYASFVATTLATIDAVLVVSHGRVPTCRC